MTDDARKPAAFVLESAADDSVTAPRQPRKAKLHIDFDTSLEAGPLVTVPVTAAGKSRGMRWGSLLLSALVGLIGLWAGLSITTLVEEFFQRSAIMGWLALSLAALAALACLAIIFREIWSLWRLRKIEHVQLLSAQAINLDNAKAATTVVEDLSALYAHRHDTAWGLAKFTSHNNDVMNPADRIKLLDQWVLRPLDEVAHQIIARRARRVTLITTVTPAAALDMLFVAAQNIIMLRELATLYGGRPSALATLRLGRLVVGHLAVTGGLALSDNLMQHVVGKGLLGRLSARFGEGAVNGIMTSRIGLAAQEVCRPIPLAAAKRETLISLLREVLTFSNGKTARDEAI